MGRRNYKRKRYGKRSGPAAERGATALDAARERPVKSRVGRRGRPVGSRRHDVPALYGRLRRLEVLCTSLLIPTVTRLRSAELEALALKVWEGLQDESDEESSRRLVDEILLSRGSQVAPEGEPRDLESVSETIFALLKELEAKATSEAKGED